MIISDETIDVRLYNPFFNQEESAHYLEVLTANIQWKQEYHKRWGKQIPFPRLTAWYGDEGKDYTYSGQRFSPYPWTSDLLEIKSALKDRLGLEFNSVLLNFYRNGQDSIGWHADDEPELGKEPVIASIAFGSARNFQLRSKRDKNDVFHILHYPGSVIVMKGKTQENYLHQLPKTSIPVLPRINLTFRNIV